MKTESRKYINIRKIAEYLGTNVATKILQIHNVTGYDTTSSLHVVGKVKLYKQIKTKTSQSLPPDETLMLLTFKRILYEVYYWSRVDEAIIFCCKIMVGLSTMRMMKFVHYDLLVCF